MLLRPTQSRISAEKFAASKVITPFQVSCSWLQSHVIAKVSRSRLKTKTRQQRSLQLCTSLLSHSNCFFFHLQWMRDCQKGPMYWVTLSAKIHSTPTYAHTKLHQKMLDMCDAAEIDSRLKYTRVILLRFATKLVCCDKVRYIYPIDHICCSDREPFKISEPRTEEKTE